MPFTLNGIFLFIMAIAIVSTGNMGKNMQIFYLDKIKITPNQLCFIDTLKAGCRRILEREGGAPKICFVPFFAQTGC